MLLTHFWTSHGRYPASIFSGLGSHSYMLGRADFSPFLGQLGSSLRMAVVHGEIGDDNRYWQGDSQYTGQRTESSHKHTDVRFRYHVAVADGCHGYQSPPKPQRDAVEVVLRVDLYSFGVVNERGEYDDPQYEEEYEKGKLFGGGAERLYENF